MTNRQWIGDRITALFSASLLLWLGLMLAPPFAVADELVDIAHADVDFLFTTVATPKDYENIVLEPVSVWYPTDDEAATASVDRLRQRAIGEFADAAMSRGLALHTEEVGNAIVARIQYIDLTTADAEPEWANQFQFRVAPGFVTIVAELRDAESGDVLVRMANLQDGHQGATDLDTLLDAALKANVDEIVASN